MKYLLSFFQSVLMTSVFMAAVSVKAADQKSPSRVIAIGDLHGDLEAFLAILKDRNLIDELGKWSGEKTNLVILGDYHDRGADTRYIMDYFMDLKPQAQKSGGDLQVVMGNHEFLVLEADLRYTTDAELESFEGFPQPKLDNTTSPLYERLIKSARSSARQAFAPVKTLPNGKKIQIPLPAKSRQAVEGFVAAHFGDSKYAKWVYEGLPMLKLGNSLFVHGGITEWALEVPFSNVNSMIKSWAGFFQGLLPLPDQKKTGWSIGDKGPLWDRTMALNKLDLDLVNEILQKLEVKRVVVGHTTKDEVEALYENQVFAIDTGNSDFYGGHISSIEILNDQDPKVSYVERPDGETALHKTLICRYRTQHGKACER